MIEVPIKTITKERDKMERQDFAYALRKPLSRRLGMQYDVEYMELEAEGFGEQPGFSIRKKQRDIFHVIYLEPYYKAYKGGGTIRQICQRVFKQYRWFSSLDYHNRPVETWDRVQKLVLPRLVNPEHHQKLLKGCTHENLLNMALTFYLPVRVVSQCMIAMRQVKTEHLSHWQTDVESLKRAAIRNMICQEGVQITSWADIQRNPGGTTKRFTGAMPYTQKQKKTAVEIVSKIGSAIETSAIPFADPAGNEETFLVTTKRGIYGAELLLDMRLLQELSERLGCSLLIAAPTVNGFTVFPYGRHFDAELIRLIFTLDGVENSQKNVILSDKIYLYDRKEKALSLYDGTV